MEIKARASARASEKNYKNFTLELVEKEEKKL